MSTSDLDSNAQASNSSFSIVEMENRILEFWRKENVFHKSLEASAACPPYIFYDGPPFATGTPHHGHLLASTIKDIIPRYFTMAGYHVQRRFGWDCHGVPIEYEIDKMLGMTAQQAVAELGIKKYNDYCRGIVQKYASQWETIITRIGRWVDFKNDYKTMDPWFMETVWWVIQQLWQKDLIYKGEKVVPFSTALGTVLSNFEASSNYKDVQDPAVTVLFKLLDSDAYIAAWTTTPWTLPSNLALCVSAKLDYVRATDETTGKVLILGQQAAERLAQKRPLKILDRVPAAELIGQSYEPLFNYFADLKPQGVFRILGDDYVSADSGTGVVHMAPAFGADDRRIALAAGIQASVCPIDTHGNFTAPVTDFQGLYVKDADKLIIKHLKDRGQLLLHETLVHSYPFCPRTDTPIIYRTIPSWYVKVEQSRAQLVENNKQIHWVPEFVGSKRMGNWLEDASDWAISRNRYWGTPIPIWENEVSGKRVCIGSVRQLEELTGATVEDLHRDTIDELTFTLEQEEGIYRRIDEVLDCWFESGSMPYAQLHYPFENAEVFEHGFPAQFVAEGLDQTRGWFYTLNVLSNALFGTPAFKNVIVNGIVMAEDGKKMSKRLGNYTPPDQLLETYGADALRLYLISSNLVKAEAQEFKDAGIEEMVRKFILPWSNAYNFFQSYASLDAWHYRGQGAAKTNLMDRWILSRLQHLKSAIASSIEKYELFNLTTNIQEFLEDLTNWYIRLNRSRYWSEGMTEDKDQAYNTLYECLMEFTLAMAPLTPFMSEHVYQELKGFTGGATELSVHLRKYPAYQAEIRDSELEEIFNGVKDTVLLGRQKRNQERIKIKTPLHAMTIIHQNPKMLERIKEMEPYIKTELNVKNVQYSDSESDYITLIGKPNFALLGKRLGKKSKEFVPLIKKLQSAELNALKRAGEIELAGERFSDEEILVLAEVKAGKSAVSNGLITIDIDCTVTPELALEGLSREIVSRIQKQRKAMDLRVEEKIKLRLAGSDDIVSAIETHQAYIAAETLAIEIAVADELPGASEFDLEGDRLLLAIERIETAA